MKRHLAALALAALTLTAACSSEPSAEEKAEDARQLTEALTSKVWYEVDGTAWTADVTLAKPDGTEQHTVDLPMKNNAGGIGVQFVASAGDFLYLSAQQASGGTTVTCRITVDGQVIAENTASGEFQIATCEGRAG